MAQRKAPFKTLKGFSSGFKIQIIKHTSNNIQTSQAIKVIKPNCYSIASQGIKTVLDSSFILSLNKHDIQAENTNR